MLQLICDATVTRGMRSGQAEVLTVFTLMIPGSVVRPLKIYENLLHGEKERERKMERVSIYIPWKAIWEAQQLTFIKEYGNVCICVLCDL